MSRSSSATRITAPRRADLPAQPVAVARPRSGSTSMKRCGSRAWCSRTSAAAMRATAPSSDRFARRISTSLTREGLAIGAAWQAWQAPHARPRISVDFDAALRFAGAVSFWLGVALLCLGGGAANEEAAEAVLEPSSDPEVETLPTKLRRRAGRPSFLALYAPAPDRGPRAAPARAADPPLHRRRLRAHQRPVGPAAGRRQRPQLSVRRGRQPGLAPLLVRRRGRLLEHHHHRRDPGPGRRAARRRQAPDRDLARRHAPGRDLDPAARRRRAAGRRLRPARALPDAHRDLPVSPGRHGVAGTIRLPLLLPRRADGDPGRLARTVRLRGQRGR